MKNNVFLWIAFVFLSGFGMSCEAQTHPKSGGDKDVLQRMLKEMESQMKDFAVPFPRIEGLDGLSLRFDTLLRLDMDSFDLSEFRMPRMDFFFDSEGDWGAEFERLFDLSPLKDLRLFDGEGMLRDDGGKAPELLPEERIRQEEERRHKDGKAPKTIRI
ncbi:MAG: hypothetical protein ACK4NS_05215 [Saprospiraceae bacterium]